MLQPSGLQICNVDDAKVIDLICTRSKLIWQFEANKYLYERRKTNNATQRRRTNQGHTKTKKSQNKNEIDVKITYFNKGKEKKLVRWVILSQKLTLNHSSLMDEGEETRVFVMAQRKKGKRENEEKLLWLSTTHFLVD